MSRSRQRQRRQAPSAAASAAQGDSRAGGEVVEITLTGMAPTGEAIGRYEGMVLFVPYGLPGETVRVRIVERKRSFGRGQIVERISESPARVVPRCPYFGRCGGCDWQHIDYAEQVRLKTALVQEQFARMGQLPDAPVRPCIASPNFYEYRNHARLYVTANGRPGYRAARSHAIVEVADCPIAEAPLRELLQDTAGTEWRAGESDDEVEGEIELRAWDETIDVGGYTFAVSDGAFFQANTGVAELLLKAVLAELPPKPGVKVLDLYCGVGLFTVPAAARGALVTGVEANPAAAEDAWRNLQAAGAAGTIMPVDVLEALQEPAVQETAWDAVILDPPRTGVAGPALELLAGLEARRLLYVSCEPSTLARDVRVLIERGWVLEWAQPFDMFPQTRHVETLAVLSADGLRRADAAERG